MRPVGLLLLLVLLAVAAVAFERPATPWNPSWYRAPHLATAPVIDGRVDEPAWEAAPWTTDFVDIEGAARPVEPRFTTRARLAWDDRALYLAAELADPHVWGTLTERDAVIFEDNDFELFLDPDGDHHLYGELEINALGTVWDLLLVRPYRDGGPAVNGWTMVGLETAVHVDGTLNEPSDIDSGWSVEIAIPWSALSDIAGDMACPPQLGDTWRLNLSRVQWEHRVEDGRYVKTPVAGRGWKGEDNWVWSPQGLVAMHAPERWGFVTFVENAADKIADPRKSWREAYEVLMPVYYAQREYREEHGVFARRLADLDASPVEIGGEQRMSKVDLEATDSAFNATLGRWTVDQEGRLARNR
jgi:hypothetical protein